MKTTVYHFINEACLNDERNMFLTDELLELHNKITMFGKIDFVLKAVELGLYRKVAEVDTDDLDNAFRLTNHIEASWTTNEGVVSFGDRLRSTSVGDILVNEEGTNVVAAFGFTKIDVEMAS